jgi:hypothetical protein
MSQESKFAPFEPQQTYVRGSFNQVDAFYAIGDSERVPHWPTPGSVICLRKFSSEIREERGFGHEPSLWTVYETPAEGAEAPHLLRHQNRGHILFTEITPNWTLVWTPPQRQAEEYLHELKAA